MEDKNASELKSNWEKTKEKLRETLASIDCLISLQSKQNRLQKKA
jgi:hypothetical protein